jgi:hypothetical protein
MDFLEEYKTALPLAGTVMFPSPFPAYARVTIVSPPRGLGLGGDFIKIVHVVNEQHFTIWLAPLEALRAARAWSNKPTEAGPFAGWELRAGDDLQRDIDGARSRAETIPNSDEVLLYHRAIAYVARSAPVIVRCETVTTAAEADEEYGDLACPVCPPPRPCCCPKKK